MQIMPGLLDNSFEFFNHNSDLKYVSDGKLKPFEEAPTSVILLLQEAIEKEPHSKAILMDWFPNSEFNQLKKFASCRLGGLDLTPDLVNGELQKGEYWHCPNRGNCPGEGIVCLAPTFNGHELSKTEIELIKLSTTNKTNEAIADILGLPMGTFHKFKNILHKKLGNIQTKQCITKIAIEMNFI